MLNHINRIEPIKPIEPNINFAFKKIQKNECTLKSQKKKII